MLYLIKVSGSHIHIPTYIIGRYKPSVRIIDLVSPTAYVVCVKLMHKFKVDSERQIFWETFPGNFIYSQSICQKSAQRKSPKKYFSYFVLMSGLGLEPRLFFSNKPTHYLLDHGDFNDSRWSYIRKNFKTFTLFGWFFNMTLFYL